LFRYQKKIIFCVFFFTLTANTTLFLQANTYASQATEKTKDIKIEESKGGLLEVLVTEGDIKEPIEGAVVIVNEQKNRTSFSCKTDKDGLARIRLAAGEYRLAGAYSLTSHAGEGQIFTIEDGKTKRFEVQLKGQPKITGVVRDKEGKPLEGVKLKVLPFSSIEAISNAEGKYEIVWDPSTWGGETPVMFLIAQDEKNNLAEAIEINVASRQLDIKLKDGIIISGSVVDENNKPIAGAALQVYFRGGNNYSSITDNGNKIGADGRFEIKAIPAEQQYYVYASAEGFGKNRINIDTGEAIKNRLDIGQTQLATANLSVTGIVTDVNDKPVAGARIYASGEGQPERYDIKTDKDGKFIIDKVCAGGLRLNANFDNPLGLSYKWGYINTEGGAKDVKIVVSEQGSSSRYVPRKPASLIGKQLPELKELGIEISPADSNDKMICVCFFDMQQRPSRYTVSELAKQVEALKGKGVTIAIIQAAKVDANSLNEWLKNRNVTLPVGQITGDEEKMKFNWGVQSLPWLILTDKKHIIKEEGFSASELEEKIKKTGM
jgi:hypothetical protein